MAEQSWLVRWRSEPSGMTIGFYGILQLEQQAYVNNRQQSQPNLCTEMYYHTISTTLVESRFTTPSISRYRPWGRGAPLEPSG